ncbi:GPSM1 [Symbiodinium natans]|uniref:GPSM1 protein n=1 Tax=Symbiodinium natans TaxID=878477 RepID=A0A812JRS7_9DINO|nr:GPSM1 [Symbiodinium natans]
MAEANLALNLEQVFRENEKLDEVRRSSEALLKQASQNGDSTLRVLGLCKAAQADLMDPAHGSRIAALEKVREAKALAEEHLLAEGAAVVKYSAARIHAKDGGEDGLDQALDLCFQAVDAFHKLGQRRAEASSMLMLGDIHGLLQQQDAAMRHYKEALAIFKEVGDHSFCGCTRHKLSKAYMMKGQFLRAAPAAQRAIDSYKAAGQNDQAQGDCWITLAEAQSQAADIPKVQESIAQARTIFADIQDVASEAKAMGVLVKAYMQNDSPAEAVDVAKQVVTRFREAGDHHGECQALLSLAKLLLPLDPEKAERIASAAMDLMRGLGMSNQLEECKDVKARCDHAKAAAEVEAKIWKRSDFMHVPRSLIVDPGCRGRLQNEFLEFAKAA